MFGRKRIAELEDKVSQLQKENDRLAQAVGGIVSLLVRAGVAKRNPYYLPSCSDSPWSGFNTQYIVGHSTKEVAERTDRLIQHLGLTVVSMPEQPAHEVLVKKPKP